MKKIFYMMAAVLLLGTSVVLALALLFVVVGTTTLTAQTPTTWGFENGATGGYTTLTVTNGGADVTISGATLAGEMNLRADFNSSVTLAVGDSFRVSGAFAYTDGSLGSQHLRFGVFNNKGTGGTVTSDQWTAGGANSFSGYLMIGLSDNVGLGWNSGGTGSIGLLTSAKTNSWISTSGSYGLGGPTETASFTAGTYDFVIGFNRLATNQMRVTLSLTKQGGGFALNGTVVDDGTNNGGSISTSTFTSFGFRVDGTSMTSIVFTNVVGTLVQAPLITVDANKDAFYGTLTGPNDGYLQIRSYANSDNGRPKSDADLSAKVWTAWDDTWFYLYTEVVDDTVSGGGTSNPWEGDNLELKVDPRATDSTQTGGSIFDMRLSAPFAETGGVVDTSLRSSIAAADKKFARRLTANGYALEFAVKLTALRLSSSDSVHAGVDSVFGFGLNVHDNDGHARQASIIWAAAMLDHVWDTPKLLGTVKFLAGNKLSFIPTNNMTGLTNPTPYDGSDYFNIAVDGQKDGFYTILSGPNDGYLQIRSYANSDNGRPKSDADLSAKVWTAWDQDWFYLYTEVRDDTVSGGGTSNPWEGDNLELKIDPRATDSTQTGGSIFDMRLSAPFAETGGVVDTSLRSSIAAADKKFARRTMTGGYALEFAVKLTALKLSSSDSVHAGVDSVFGFGLNVHDNDGHARQASIIWAAAMLDHVWDTPKLLGTVKFLAGNKLSFIPTNNMTGLTNPTPYDGSDYFNIAVDGQKDGFYTILSGPNDGYLQMRSYAYSDNGAPVSDADLSAKVWTAWDNTWFYLYTEVRDDTVSGGGTSNPWEGDNLELKIDPRATDSTQTGGSIFDMRLSAPFAETGGVVDTSLRSSIAAADKKFARRTMTGGYALEFAVKLTALKLSSSDSVHAGVDSVFGFGLNVHDNDGHARQASIIWAAAMLDHVWDTPKLLGTVKFLAGNKLSFIPTNNMTGLTNPIPYDGSEYIRVGVDEPPQVPIVFSLKQNYPNPFNPTTTISYSIPSNSRVRLTVYDILGRQLAVLVDEMKEPGNYRSPFGGGQWASGVYFYRLEAGQNIATQKMMLLK